MRLLLIGCTGLVRRGLIPLLHELAINSLLSVDDQPPRSAYLRVLSPSFSGSRPIQQQSPAGPPQRPCPRLLQPVMAVNLAGEPIAER